MARGNSNDPSELMGLTKAIIEKKTHALSAAVSRVTPEQFGAKGDGVTDDSEAVQAACDAGYEVRFADNKTYYLADTVVIEHDCHLVGGKNSVIKMETPSGGSLNDGIVVRGTLKKTTTLTTDYSASGNTDNCINKFTLTDMDGIQIGDIMVITAKDQYYSYARQYYYLGATLLVTDIYDGHIYTNIGMPFDITNTEDVSVKVYDAPTAIVEGLKFVADLDSGWNYRRCLSLNYNKNSIVSNCEMTEMDTGLYISECVNTLIEDVSLSKSKYDNTLNGDGYGVCIDSSTQTVVRRMNSLCAQACMSLGGTIPCIDTFVYNSNLNSECRAIGIDMHENSYNIMIEDCTVGGMSLYGTATVNRCRIVKNMRMSGSECSVLVRGSHDPDRAVFKFRDCIFNDSFIYIGRPTVQNPIQSFANIIGMVEVVGCENGFVTYNPTTTTDVTSNTINELIIKNWKNCGYIYHTSGNKIKYLLIEDTDFTGAWFLTNYNDSLYTDGIEQIDMKNARTGTHKVFFDRDTRGESVVMPGKVQITVSSNNQNAKFVVCGSNLLSDNADDYFVGTVSGSVGGDPTRSPANVSYPNVTIDQDKNIIWTQGNNTSKYCLFPVGMFYVKDNGVVSMSASLVNSGATDPETFYPYILIVNSKTGKVRERNNGSSKTASAGGTAISYERNVVPGDIVMCYYYCGGAVSGAVTTFENPKVTYTPYFAPAIVEEEYKANRRTGNGTLESVPGVNNIMCSEMIFNVKFGADLMNNPVWS